MEVLMRSAWSPVLEQLMAFGYQHETSAPSPCNRPGREPAGKEARSSLLERASCKRKSLGAYRRVFQVIFLALPLAFCHPPAEADFGSTAPAGSLSINGKAASTRSTAVTVTLSATDMRGVTGYYLSTSSTRPASTTPGWVAVASTPSYS